MVADLRRTVILVLECEGVFLAKLRSISIPSSPAPITRMVSLVDIFVELEMA